MCMCMHACMYGWPYPTNIHRFSLHEGIVQTLNPYYDKEAARALGLLLTSLSTEDFSSFHEQREKL